MLSHFSHVLLFVTPWTVACQPHLSMGFWRQESWNGLPCPPAGDLDPGIEPLSLASSALQGNTFTAEPPTGKAQYNIRIIVDALKSSSKRCKNNPKNAEKEKHEKKPKYPTQK